MCSASFYSLYVAELVKYVLSELLTSTEVHELPSVLLPSYLDNFKIA